MHGVSPFLWSIESRDNLTEHERPGGEHEGNFLYVEVSPVFFFFFVFRFFFVFEDHEGNFLYVDQQCLVLDLAVSFCLPCLCFCISSVFVLPTALVQCTMGPGRLDSSLIWRQIWPCPFWAEFTTVRQIGAQQIGTRKFTPLHIKPWYIGPKGEIYSNISATYTHIMGLGRSRNR